jgi:hypothetical protein
MQEAGVGIPMRPGRETWLAVTSDSFRLSSNQPIFKATQEGKHGPFELQGGLTDGELERPFSLLVF